MPAPARNDPRSRAQSPLVKYTLVISGVCFICVLTHRSQVFCEGRVADVLACLEEVVSPCLLAERGKLRHIRSVSEDFLSHTEILSFLQDRDLFRRLCLQKQNPYY